MHHTITTHAPGLARISDSTIVLLPPDLQEKFNAFEDAYANATSALDGAKVAEASAREDYDAATTNLANLEARAAADRTTADYTSQISAAKERRERARKRLDAKSAEVAAAIRRSATIRDVAARCARKAEGSRTFEPTPARGEDGNYYGEQRGRIHGLTLRMHGEVKIPARATLKAVAAEVDALRVHRADIANALPDRDEVERELFDNHDAAARRGAISVDLGHDGLGDYDARHAAVVWPTNSSARIDVEALLARHCGAAIKAEISAALDRRYEGVTLTLDARTKAKTLKEIDARLLELGRVECALIWQDIKAGGNAFFRPDADVRAVLGIA